MFKERAMQGGQFRIGILVEIMNALCSTRVQFLHLGGVDGKRVCGYVHIDNEDQVLQVSRPLVIIRCYKCLTRVQVAWEDRWELMRAYRDALDPLSKNKQHCVAGVEFVLLSPNIVPAQSVGPSIPAVMPRPWRRKLFLIHSRK